jgi:dTMP kinase
METLKNRGKKAIMTREPGGTGVAEGIRAILLDPDNKITEMAELLLYEAGRAQHAKELILPALEDGYIVICDRFTDATLAYQGYGRGIDIATINKLNKIASLGLTPGLTVYLDIAVNEGLRRAKALNKDSFTNGDRIERESLSFHQRVRKGYLTLARKEPRRIKVIRTAATIEETADRIFEVVSSSLKRHGV